MAEEITIEVGDSFAQRHEQFIQQLGDQYELRVRDLVEDEIHGITKNLERTAEQQQPDVEGGELPGESASITEVDE